MASIASALRRIKVDLATILEPSFIERVSREIGHRWRDRCLGPAATIHLFILQMLARNTACRHLSHLSGWTFTASAYCQARRRLPLTLITTLFARLINAVQQDERAERPWHGHRTILIDGSGFSMPDTPALQAHFGQPGGQKKGCGWVANYDNMDNVTSNTSLLADTLASQDCGSGHRAITLEAEYDELHQP